MGREKSIWPGVILSVALLSVGLSCAGLPSPAVITPVPFSIAGTVALTEDQALYRSPTWSPDGRMIAALKSPVYPPPRGPITEGDVVLLSLAAGQQSVILAPPTVKPESSRDSIFWLPGGREIAFYYYNFADQQESPYLILYDLGSQEARSINLCRCWPIALNKDGSELLVNDSPEGTFRLSWWKLETGDTRIEISLIPSDPRQHQYYDFSLSPDGGILLLDDLQGNIFKYQIGSGEAPTNFLSQAVSPGWSPDGSKLVYSQLRQRGTSSLDYYDGELLIANADGSSPERLILETQPAGMLSPAWSPDGTQIAFLYGNQHSNAILIADVPASLRP